MGIVNKQQTDLEINKFIMESLVCFLIIHIEIDNLISINIKLIFTFNQSTSLVPKPLEPSEYAPIISHILVSVCKVNNRNNREYISIRCWARLLELHVVDSFFSRFVRVC